MRKAAIIGVDDYPSAPLTACVQDAEAVYELLRRNDDGSPNFDARLYRNPKTTAQLTGIIYDLFSGSNEVALLYFSGHGQRNDLDSFLMAPDSGTYGQGLSFANLLRMANDSKSKQRLLLLDCCFSGAAGTVNVLGESASLLADGVTIISASMHNETSKEVMNRHGVFTDLLLQGLDGGAADVNGTVTTGTLYSFIDQVLGAHDQRPVFKANVAGFTVIRRSKGSVSAGILRRLCDYFPRPDYRFPLDPSYEASNVPGGKSSVEPFVTPQHLEVFRDLQRYRSAGLLEPMHCDHLYDAAMQSQSCRLTPLGMHYWRLVKRNRL